MQYKQINQVLSGEVKEILKESNIKAQYHNKGGTKARAKYTKLKYVNLYPGYDFLENFFLVRMYLQRRYKIDFNLLEILLYLVPKGIFTQSAYTEIPKQYRYCSIKNILNSGYIDVVQNGPNYGKKIYTVNRKGIEIVTAFYEHLSGEKKIPEIPKLNPLASSKATKYDAKKMALIKKVNAQPVAASKRALFE